jgi:hypothetical protein
MKRGTLHKSKILDFVDWLENNGFEVRDGKGEYQELQVNVGRKFIPIYDRNRGDHYTIQEGPLLRLAYLFARENKNKEKQS